MKGLIFFVAASLPCLANAGTPSTIPMEKIQQQRQDKIAAAHRALADLNIRHSMILEPLGKQLEAKSLEWGRAMNKRRELSRIQHKMKDRNSQEWRDTQEAIEKLDPQSIRAEVDQVSRELDIARERLDRERAIVLEAIQKLYARLRQDPHPIRIHLEGLIEPTDSAEKEEKPTPPLRATLDVPAIKATGRQ